MTWTIDDVEVEESGTWLNTLRIDISCTDDEHASLVANNGRISGSVMAWPSTGWRKDIPTVVGYFSFKAKNDFADKDDRDLEIVLENVPLLWDVKHTVELSVREHDFRQITRRDHQQLEFVLEEDVKVTDFPEIKDLEVVKVVKLEPDPSLRKGPGALRAKVKVRWRYDFGGQDAWFYVHHNNVHQWRSERLCRHNSAGRCAAWIYLPSGDHDVEIVPYDPGSGATGVVASIGVRNPH